jgi:hypothetical protein
MSIFRKFSAVLTRALLVACTLPCLNQCERADAGVVLPGNEEQTQGTVVGSYNGVVGFGWSCPVANPLESDVVVQKLEAALPSGRLNTFLWDTFGNKTEVSAFTERDITDWRSVFERFAARLVEKAKWRGLDHQSLRKCLDAVLEDAKRCGHIAYLPVGAYQATRGTASVWIILVNWEYESPEEKGPLHLSHFRMFVFDAKTIERVGFTTCR